MGSERSLAVPPRSKKQKQLQKQQTLEQQQQIAPLPPPRKANQSEMLRSQSTDLLPMEIYGYIGRQLEQQQQQQQYKQNINIGNNNYVTHAPTQSFLIGSPSGSGSSAIGGIGGGTKKMVKQLSNASQQSSSSTSSSVQSAPPAATAATPNADKRQSPGRWSLSTMQQLLSVHHEHEQQLQPMQHYKQQLQQQSHFAPAPTTANIGAGKNHDIESHSTASTSTASVASAHSDTTVEDVRLAGGDDISLTGSLKKRKRRLRFPFGRRKSGSASNDSNKTKLA